MAILAFEPASCDGVDGDGGDRGVQRQDGVDRRVGLQLRLDRRLRALQVVDVDLQVRDRAAEALRRAGAALLEADVAGLVDHAEHLLHAGLASSSLPGALAGDRLVLADVGDRAELRRLVAAGVDRDDRDAGRDGRLDRLLSASGLAIETTRPSTFWSTAASISCACCAGRRRSGSRR